MKKIISSLESTLGSFVTYTVLAAGLVLSFLVIANVLGNKPKTDAPASVGSAPLAGGTLPYSAPLPIVGKEIEQGGLRVLELKHGWLVREKSDEAEIAAFFVPKPQESLHPLLQEEFRARAVRENETAATMKELLRKAEEAKEHGLMFLQKRKGGMAAIAPGAEASPDLSQKNKDEKAMPEKETIDEIFQQLRERELQQLRNFGLKPDAPAASR